MHVEIHIPGAERIESLRSHIERRLRSRIARHGGRVRRVDVRLSELFGHERGTVLTSCRLEADVDSLPGPVAAHAVEANPYHAFDTAIQRLSLALHGEAVRPERTTPDDSTQPEATASASQSMREGRVPTRSDVGTARAARSRPDFRPAGRRPRRDTQVAPAGVSRGKRSWRSV